MSLSPTPQASCERLLLPKAHRQRSPRENRDWKLPNTNLTAMGRDILKTQLRDYYFLIESGCLGLPADHFSMGWGRGGISQHLPTLTPWASKEGSWLEESTRTLRAGSTHRETGACTCLGKARGSALPAFAAVTLQTALTAAAAAAATAARPAALAPAGPSLRSLKRLSLWFRTRGGRAAVLCSHWTRGSRCYPVARSVARRRWRPSNRSGATFLQVGCTGGGCRSKVGEQGRRGAGGEQSPKQGRSSWGLSWVQESGRDLGWESAAAARAGLLLDELPQAWAGDGGRPCLRPQGRPVSVGPRWGRGGIWNPFLPSVGVPCGGWVWGPE